MPMMVVRPRWFGGNGQPQQLNIHLRERRTEPPAHLVQQERCCPQLLASIHQALQERLRLLHFLVDDPVSRAR
jgi:hypothetical protein